MVSFPPEPYVGMRQNATLWLPICQQNKHQGEGVKEHLRAWLNKGIEQKAHCAQALPMPAVSWS